MGEVHLMGEVVCFNWATWLNRFDGPCQVEPSYSPGMVFSWLLAAVKGRYPLARMGQSRHLVNQLLP